MGASRGQKLIPLVLAAALGALFWIPSMPAGRGWFPVPLDDVYIHFDYAKALGQGSPFAWIAGQGYSSGETAPLYAVALAIGWLVGFRGPLIGVWAAIIAVLSVASLLASVRRLLLPLPGWLAWLLALLPFSIGIVDWSIFSGMELALFVALLGRALEALERTRSSTRRERSQWRLGLWGIALVLVRPEAVVIIAVLAVLAARGARRRSGLAAVVRASLPGALTTGAVALANWGLTGDYRSAGAALKLLSSNPYMTEVDRARVYVENLVTFWLKALRGELAVWPAFVFVLPLVAALGLFGRRHRTLVAACLGSAFFWTLLVTWNGNAPHHNFRYYVPALVLVGMAASFSLASLPRRGAAGGAVLLIALAAPKIPGQVRYFAACCANIRDQHVEIGLKLASYPPSTILLVGDAGAIPYVSNKHAVDALGLGGAGAVREQNPAVHGEAAVIEDLEELAPGRRPTHLVLYPNWFANLSSRFGREVDRVTVASNVIGGGPTKVIYEADWSSFSEPTMGRRGPCEEVDVGHVASELASGYVSPQPHGGWTTLDIRIDDRGNRVFDGGRIIPDGARESFILGCDGTKGPVEIRMRVDDAARGITLYGSHGVLGELELRQPIADRWRIGSIRVPHLKRGDRLTFEAHGGEYRDHHIWVLDNDDRDR